MKGPITAAVLLGVMFGPAVSNLRAEITAEQVRQAIDKAVGYLKQQQRNDGSWPDWGAPAGGMSNPGGVTALCTLALLSAGVEPGDQHIQRALKKLRTSYKPQTTYVTSLQTMVFCKAEPKKDLMYINRNVKWLERMQITSGPKKGAWSYSSPSGGDNSNAQFALLALHEAQRAGVEVQGRTWRLAKAYWEDCQNIDGSWGYWKGQTGTGSMTCAGIASLVIASDKVRQSDAKVTAAGNIDCCGQGEVDNDRIERALQWMASKFSVDRNPNQRGQVWVLYYLYGLERVGRLTNRRFIGEHDWYRLGTEKLVKDQDPLSGFIIGVGHAENDPLIGTSLALLFLCKGRRPILMAKLRHTPSGDWNQHRSDVDNLTRYVESRWRLDLTWQVVDLHAASVEDLLQSPVLYLCGNLSPLPPSADARKRLARKLRDYLDRGGFLFAEGYCGGTGFDRGFRELMEQVFPEREYRLRLLEPEHPIWHAEEKVDPEQLRTLEGIEFGCRTSVVYAPANTPRPRPSLSCLWELSRGGRGQKFPAAVRAQVDAGMSIGVNVLAYATNRELKPKEDSLRAITESRPADTVERGRIYIAKLRHPGGCNSAPRALINLLESAGRELNIRASARDKLLDITDESLFDHHLVFMHGRNSFRLTDAERKQLGTYIRRGGMLMADSICASRAFTESFRREMAAIFPDAALERIPADDPMLRRDYGGFDLKTVTRRDPQPRGREGPLRTVLKRVPPELEGIKIDGRWGVIFSRYDLSCALEKHESLECHGYTREDAARIGLNVVLYSLHE